MPIGIDNEPTPATNPVPAPAPQEKKTTFKIFENLSLSSVLPWLVIAYLIWQQQVQPTPVPAPTPVPTGNLASRVSPDAAVELANLYHCLALGLQEDGKPLDGQQSKSVINTIGDFYNYQDRAGANFQRINNVTGIAAVNQPISDRLRGITGDAANKVDQSKPLDAPNSNMRQNLVTALKLISEEFDERYRSIPLSQMP